MAYQVIVYGTANGKYPFNDWLSKLDRQDRYRVAMRIDRLHEGNFSNCKPVDVGIYEIVMDTGPGFRTYYSRIEHTAILIRWHKKVSTKGYK